MTPNRVIGIAFRLWISAVFAARVFAPSAQAQGAAVAINGVYNGTYSCAMGPRTLKLSLLASGDGSLTGVFTFYLPPTSHTQAFSYSMSGTFDTASGKFKLDPVKWEVPPPGNYVMVGMQGAFDPATGQVTGKITYGSCGNFQATRDRAASASVASVAAPQPRAAGTARPAPRTEASARPSPGSPAVPASKAPAASAPPPRTESGAGDRDGETSSASVALRVCNAGKVAIDAFVAHSGKVSSAHVDPADCAVVAKTAGSMGPAYVGFAFVDARGQWGAARRLDLLPDFGNGVLTPATQSVSVQHGNTTVSLSMQLLFQPPAPICRTSQPYSAVAHLPLNATLGQLAAARAQDANAPPASTTCDALSYVLNALAYPDSQEVTFNQFCDPCDKKAEARITPEERAAKQQRSAAINQEIGNLRATGTLGELVMGNLAKQANQQAQEEEREREQERIAQLPESYRRMTWDELHLALRNLRASGGRPPEMPRYLIIRGTVSRVDVSPPQASEHWVNVYFRESPEQASTVYETVYGAFNVCTLGQEIFQDMFGPDFRSRMLGQVLEIQGEYQRNYCKGWKGSIRVTLARQVRRINAGK